MRAKTRKKRKDGYSKKKKPVLSRSCDLEDESTGFPHANWRTNRRPDPARCRTLHRARHFPPRTFLRGRCAAHCTRRDLCQEKGLYRMCGVHEIEGCSHVCYCLSYLTKAHHSHPVSRMSPQHVENTRTATSAGRTWRPIAHRTFPSLIRSSETSSGHLDTNQHRDLYLSTNPKICQAPT